MTTMWDRFKTAVQAIDVATLDRAGLVALAGEIGTFRAALDGLEARIAVGMRRLGVSEASTAETLRRQTGCSAREAKHRTRRAEILKKMPNVAEALSSGRLTGEHASALARAAAETSPEAVDRDAGLLAEAESVPADVASGKARDWVRRRQTGDDLQRLHQWQRRNRSLMFGAGEGGMIAGIAKFDQVSGAQFQNLVEALADRLYRADGGRDNPQARTRAQCRLDALLALVGLEPAPPPGPEPAGSTPGIQPARSAAPRPTLPGTARPDLPSAGESARSGGTRSGSAGRWRVRSLWGYPVGVRSLWGYPVAGESARSRICRALVSPLALGAPGRICRALVSPLALGAPGRICRALVSPLALGAPGRICRALVSPLALGAPGRICRALVSPLALGRPGRDLSGAGESARSGAAHRNDSSEKPDGKDRSELWTPDLALHPEPVVSPPPGSGPGTQSGTAKRSIPGGDPIPGEVSGLGPPPGLGPGLRSAAGCSCGRGFGPKAQLCIVMDLEYLATDGERGRCEIPGVGAMARSELERLGCDAEIYGLIFDGRGVPLYHGRRTRRVSPQQWRALVARDRGCVICGAAPSLCQAHHVKYWILGGRTDVDNLALVCHLHHRWIHDNRIILRWGSDGWRAPPGPAPPGLTARRPGPALQPA